jgi:hypothetical protein
MAAYPVNESAYAEWREYREKEKRIKIGKLAEKKQRALLGQYPPETQQEIIDHSIMNSYQGIFPPKGNQNRGQTDGAIETIYVD